MARKPRIHSTTGIYHCLVRSISGLTLVIDDEDAQQYSHLLTQLQQKYGCTVYAYALMPTHIHLLVSQGESDIGTIMKSLAINYAYYYNVKYDHYGPVYQDRYKSQPVETRPYYLRVLDHIAQQPTQWSHHHTVVPAGLAQEGPQPPLLHYAPRPTRLSDSTLIHYLQSEHHFTNSGEFLQRPSTEQARVIALCRQQGASIRQLTRLTGAPFHFVYQSHT